MVNPMFDSIRPPWPARPALFLDLDGTLLEIADEPAHAAPNARLRALLPHLAPATQGAVAIVSGRTILELDRLLAPHCFAAAGIHGLERRDATGRIRAAPADADALARVRSELEPFVARHPGVLLEDKRMSYALHYRKAPELEREVSALVSALELGFPPSLEVLSGRMVFEIKPRGVDKGRAIQAFMQESPFAGRTAVFLGDDVTDESGFEIVNGLGGVSVKVHTGATAAHWRLAGVDAVLAWLEHAVGGSLGMRAGAANE